MTRVLAILLMAIVGLHAFFWLRWQEIHPCRVAVARSTVTFMDAVTKAPQIAKLMRGEDLVACYRIAILGPDAEHLGEAR